MAGIKAVGTPGGNRLRTLRENADKTQLEVELEASLGIGYLQRVESGKVGQPEHETLDRILAALGARYTERRDVLELFGYVVDTPLPTDADIQWAVDACQAELHDAVFPAYVLDCAHRLLAWNHFFPKLFMRDDARFVSMLNLIFDPTYGVTPRIGNPDEFFPSQIRALRHQMQVIRGERWSEALINDLLLGCPTFATYWRAVAADQKYALPARPLVALELSVPPLDLLRFRLTSEAFAQDRRFRVIYYLPADPHTMQQCAIWVASRTNS
ncbi:MAG: helix-turn-helix domain-containing protein [Anaerolineae bacterium]|nr:helix-turn-helix domain-containing protein [Anaerolineae bacterium]